MARGGRGLCVRCVSCERTLYGVPVTSGVEVYVLAVFRVSVLCMVCPLRLGSRFMCSLCFV